MKIVLLVLSGDPDQAGKWLAENYSGAAVEGISRDQLEKQTARQRIKILRSLAPDIFAVATERLAWQSGQNSLLAFGFLAGARRVLLFDLSGNRREETRASIFGRTPFRIARESAASALAIAHSHFGLKRLEREVKNRAIASLPKRPHESAKPLRIAYLRSTPGVGSQAGGAATHIGGFIKAARELGIELRVITNDYLAGVDNETLTLIDPEPLGVTRAAFDLRNNLVFSAAAVREIERAPVDLIYQRYARFSWAGVAASLRTGAPLFLEYNGSEVWIGKHWDGSGQLPLLERFERLNLAAAARIFVVAEAERRNLLRASVAEEKIIVNPNGVDTEKFRPAIGGAAIRSELGIAGDETLAGFVGTFGPWHGVLTLAEAITLLPADSKVRFLLVGGGKLLDEVKRIVSTAGKKPQVIFAGHIEHERVPALLDACDILLSPHVPLADGSEFFGSPTKLFEYMAMGKGIVASRLGQIGEVLVNNETALLTEPGNARALADAILHLADAPDLRERLGAAARAAAIAKHTWKHNAQRVLDSHEEWLRSF